MALSRASTAVCGTNGSERDAVLQPGQSQSRALGVATRLQHHKAALEARMADTDRLRGHVPPAAGSDAPHSDWLRACPRRSTGPRGPIQPPERTQDWIKDGGNVTETKMALLPVLLDDYNQCQSHSGLRFLSPRECRAQGASTNLHPARSDKVHSRCIAAIKVKFRKQGRH